MLQQVSRVEKVYLECFTGRIGLMTVWSVFTGGGLFAERGIIAGAPSVPALFIWDPIKIEVFNTTPPLVPIQ